MDRELSSADPEPEGTGDEGTAVEGSTPVLNGSDMRTLVTGVLTEGEKIGVMTVCTERNMSETGELAGPEELIDEKSEVVAAAGGCGGGGGGGGGAGG